MSEKKVAEEAVAVVEQEATGVAVLATRKGFERMDIESITIPTARLLQSISKEVTEDEFAEFGFKAGMLIHGLLLDKLPELFTPILVFDDNILFIPKNAADKALFKETLLAKFGYVVTDEEMNNNMFLCRAKDGKTGDSFGSCASCGLNKFDREKKPICTANVNVLAVFDGQDLPVVIKFANTSYKHGKSFKDLTYYAGGNLFDRRYKVVPFKKQSDGNTWFEAKVMPAGITPIEIRVMAEALHDKFLGMSVEAAIDREETGSTATPSTPSTPSTEY